MDRIFRIILLALISFALVSCGLFYSPIKGRWNFNDPKNELLMFKPSLDGYAYSIWEGSLDLLAHPTSKIILLRFDTADFPDVVAESYLELTVTSPPANSTLLSVFRIKGDWKTVDISYSFVDQPGKFYDDSAVANFTVPYTVLDRDVIRIPVTKVFSGEKKNLAYGIVIYSEVNIDFDSMETGTAPVLMVEPE